MRFNAGARGATIDLAVLDDDAEPTREVLVISLDEPGDGAGYTLGDTAAAVLTIEEGVCDRTPRVRDELVRLTRANHCRETDDSRLSEIDTLDLRGPEPAGALANLYRLEELWLGEVWPTVRSTDWAAWNISISRATVSPSSRAACSPTLAAWRSCG